MNPLLILLLSLVLGAAVALVLYALIAVGHRRVPLRKHDRSSGHCIRCGYSVKGLGEHPRCPECGERI